MGLLSDPEYGSVKWVKLLKRVHGPLCFLCFVGALVWFVMLGNKEFNNETYFSENALLPGLVTNEFNAESSAKKYFNDLTMELEDKYSDSEEIPVPWLVAKMSQLHLEVYTHNFTLNYPMGQGQVYKGTNVYGILRAARTPSLEALVVTAPFRPLGSHQKETTAGIALMLAFAQFARPQKYWAKDIIFLITEHEQLGMQAWLEAYHGLNSNAGTFYTSLGSFWKPGTPKLDIGNMAWFDLGNDHQKCLDPGRLKGRSGSIQAAINLEFHTPKIKYIEVKVEGLNGQLPNLDLVNLVHKLCVKSGIHHSYKNSYSWIRTRNKYDEWTNGIVTILGMVTSQIAGVPNGNHGLFHRFGIEAVTLEGRDARDPAAPPPSASALTPCNFYRLGIALESILRSLNNLLESFHQSYFFYLLAATNRFISIGQYMPSLCLLCVAMIVRALYLWVTIQENDDEQPVKRKRKNSDAAPGDQKTKENKEETQEAAEETVKHKQKNSDEVPGEHEVKELVKKNKKKRVDSSMSIVNIGANYILVHLIGYGVMNSPLLFSKIGAMYEQSSEFSVYYGLLATSVLLVFLTPLLPRVLSKGRISYDEMSLVNILMLVELATVCLTVGMHNFPLGFAIAVLYTPLALVAGVQTRGGKGWLAIQIKRLLCLILSPLCAVTLGMVIYSGFLFPEEDFLSMAGRGRDAAMQATMFSIVDSLIYGNWLYNVTSCVILPIWIIFWQILCNRVEEHT
ncbi:glycosylphosphatidylinositol anchor attachment 1 protein [Plodia interpunctella]|uniref:glycosylphosphatidylinositol anchor attachment 1 protein n=1 Tax=Plodia interpunctella TaxID=58824 RepID=UPI002367FE34|nr:glycosylphosphatidylinositol anchor attachment 1 protein [Plodia interpunctella]